MPGAVSEGLSLSRDKTNVCSDLLHVNTIGRIRCLYGMMNKASVFSEFVIRFEL